jgi:hypothetical protein
MGAYIDRAQEVEKNNVGRCRQGRHNIWYIGALGPGFAP